MRNRKSCGEKLRREVFMPAYTVDFCCLALALEVEVDGQPHLSGGLQRRVSPMLRFVGCDDTGVLLITPKVMPNLSNHPRRKRIREVLQAAMDTDKPSIKANVWGYYASRLPVVAFDFTVSRHRDGPEEVLDDFEDNVIGDRRSVFLKGSTCEATRESGSRHAGTTPAARSTSAVARSRFK